MSESNFSFQSVPMSYNGQPLGGGVFSSMDLGGSTLDYQNSTFAFMQSSNAQNQAFLGASIAGSNTFLSNQLTPLSNGIAQAQANNLNQSASMAASLTDYAAKLIAASNSNTQASIVSIQAMNQASIDASRASANSGGGGGSFVCTAAHELGILSDDEYSCLVEFKDNYMQSTTENRKKLVMYYRGAPEIVDNLKKSIMKNILFKSLKNKYLNKVIANIKAGENAAALVTYENMMNEAQLMAGAC
jgi:hypothetical protein